MHTIHHTEGFIISGIDTKEADRFLTILTKDFGLIRATAGGVRKLSSKLRYVLADMSHAKIDLVEGRDVWRVTSASKGDIFDGLIDDPSLVPMFGRLFALVVRLCRGEEENIPLYTMLAKGCACAVANPSFDRETREALEIRMVGNTLAILGYGESFPIDTEGDQFSESALEYVRKNKHSILAHINRTLRETHL